MSQAVCYLLINIIFVSLVPYEACGENGYDQGLF